MKTNRIYTQDQIDQAMDRFRRVVQNFDDNVVEQVNADKELAALLKATKQIRFGGCNENENI